MTKHTITNAQIQAMRDEAALETDSYWADSDLVVLCEEALAGDDAARAECAQILAETEAAS